MNLKLKDIGGGTGLKTKVFTLTTAIALSGAAALVPLAALADHTTAHTIEQLQAQITQLTAQLSALSGAAPAPAPAGATAASSCTFTRSLSQGVKGDDVMCLQKYLNSAGFKVAASGAGSPGSETTFFGSLTKKAVAAWQAANGVSPAVGYFGTISRAKFDSMMAVAPAPAPGVTPPVAPGTPPAPVAIGTGLTVSAAAEQPAAALVPLKAARAPFTKVVLTASADGDVTIKTITVERQGLSDDDAFDSVLLLDENNLQIGLSRTLNSLHQAVLNESVVVKAGTSRTMTIAGNMVSTSGDNAGQVAKLAVVAVDAGTSKVNGTLPIAGNGMTINESLSIGSLTTPARGTLDPGANQGSLEVGRTGFYSSGARWTVGAAEPIILEQVRWNQAGSVASGDLTNVKARIKDKDYDTTLSSDGKYYIAKFDPGIEFAKGDPIDIALKLDVVSGSNRTLNIDILRRTDVVAKGKTYGYYIIPANGSSAAAADSGNMSSSEPYYDGFVHTISKGTLRVEKSNAVLAGNVPLSISGVELGAFNIEAKGEPVQVSAFKLTFGIGTVAGSAVTNVALYDANGAVIAGPKDVASDRTVNFTDTWTAATGVHVYKVKGKLGTAFSDGNTLTASTTPGSDITAKGLTTGLSITPTPSSAVGANQMTIRAASLKVSVSAIPAAQNVVRGINNFIFSKIQYDAGVSGEDLRVTSQELTLLPSGTGDIDDVNSCQMFDGATALNTGGNVVSPTGTTLGASAKKTFTFDNALLIPKGTVKTVDVKCNISASFVAAATLAIGLNAGTEDTVVVGKDTGTSVTENIVAANAGQIMTVRASGAVRVSLDTSSPSERYGLAGKTDVLSSVFKLEADYEDVTITRFAFTLASSTASTSDVAKVTFWDGATKVGESVFTGVGFNATSTFGGTFGNFIVPKDGNKLLTAKIDLASPTVLGKADSVGADSGHLIRVNWDASRTTTIEGTGGASGSTLNGTVGSDTDAKGIRLVKTTPTLERLALPSNTLADGDMDLYRFKITADAAGDIGLFRLTFRISSTTNATTSLFRLFAYTDSGFSTQAYAVNPINANDIDCVGSTSLEEGANDACTADNSIGGARTSPFSATSTQTTQISVFFDPATNVATTPNAEAINVPAGASRYFKLVGSVSGSKAGDSLSVALLGDNRFDGLVTNNNTLYNATTTATQFNFVWSPNTTSTSATSTNDWLSGYLVPGLPSTELSQQTLSK